MEDVRSVKLTPLKTVSANYDQQRKRHAHIKGISKLSKMH